MLSQEGRPSGPFHGHVESNDWRATLNAMNRLAIPESHVFMGSSPTVGARRGSFSLSEADSGAGGATTASPADPLLQSRLLPRQRPSPFAEHAAAAGTSLFATRGIVAVAEGGVAAGAGTAVPTDLVSFAGMGTGMSQRSQGAAVRGFQSYGIAFNDGLGGNGSDPANSMSILLQPNSQQDVSQPFQFPIFSEVTRSGDIQETLNEQKDMMGAVFPHWKEYLHGRKRAQQELRFPQQMILLSQSQRQQQQQERKQLQAQMPPLPPFPLRKDPPQQHEQEYQVTPPPPPIQPQLQLQPPPPLLPQDPQKQMLPPSARPPLHPPHHHHQQHQLQQLQQGGLLQQQQGGANDFQLQTSSCRARSSSVATGGVPTVAAFQEQHSAEQYGRQPTRDEEWLGIGDAGAAMVALPRPTVEDVAMAGPAAAAAMAAAHSAPVQPLPPTPAAAPGIAHGAPEKASAPAVRLRQSLKATGEVVPADLMAPFAPWHLHAPATSVQAAAVYTSCPPYGSAAPPWPAMAVTTASLGSAPFIASGVPQLEAANTMEPTAPSPPQVAAASMAPFVAQLLPPQAEVVVPFSRISLAHGRMRREVTTGMHPPMEPLKGQRLSAAAAPAAGLPADSDAGAATAAIAAGQLQQPLGEPEALNANNFRFIGEHQRAWDQFLQDHLQHIQKVQCFPQDQHGPAGCGISGVSLGSSDEIRCASRAKLVQGSGNAIDDTFPLVAQPVDQGPHWESRAATAAAIQGGGPAASAAPTADEEARQRLDAEKLKARMLRRFHEMHQGFGGVLGLQRAVEKVGQDIFVKPLQNYSRHTAKLKADAAVALKTFTTKVKRSVEAEDDTPPPSPLSPPAKRHAGSGSGASKTGVSKPSSVLADTMRKTMSSSQTLKMTQIVTGEIRGAPEAGTVDTWWKKDKALPSVDDETKRKIAKLAEIAVRQINSMPCDPPPACERAAAQDNKKEQQKQQQ